MTKQHFQAFADEIKRAPYNEVIRHAMAVMVIEVAKQFNGRFDQARFLKAAGLEGE